MTNSCRVFSSQFSVLSFQFWATLLRKFSVLSFQLPVVSFEQLGWGSFQFSFLSKVVEEVLSWQFSVLSFEQLFSSQLTVISFAQRLKVVSFELSVLSKRLETWCDPSRSIGIRRDDNLLSFDSCRFSVLCFQFWVLSFEFWAMGRKLEGSYSW